MVTGTTATWAISGLATAGVIVRPANWPEAVWALAGAAALLIFGLIPPDAAFAGVVKGLDVYLFLTGMMLLAEVARREGLFDWLARIAISTAKGSPTRLFGLIYGVGIVVTALLSNDATAVVLTPAVLAATKAARVKNPVPYVLICAFIANAASFVLPISNPANLVVFGGGHMPPLGVWIGRFLAPSVAAIAITYVALFLTQRRSLACERIEQVIETEKLSSAGKMAAAGIAATAIVLVSASALDVALGAPSAVLGVLTAGAALAVRRETPWTFIREISWGVLPLVAGLFVLVEALSRTGAVAALADILGQASAASPQGSAWGAGVVVAFACNLVNNLPAGLLAGAALQSAHVSPDIAAATLIGVDLGPNLSVTGSLATILWLTALRRDNVSVSAWQFFKLGLAVMTPALFGALAAALWFSSP